MFIWVCEVVGVPIGLLLSYPVCRTLIRSSARTGWWTFGSALVTGATLGFIIGALIGGLFMGPFIAFEFAADFMDIVVIACFLGVHASVMYGIPCSVLVLFDLSRSKEEVRAAVFFGRHYTSLIFIALLLSIMGIWHSIAWKIFNDYSTKWY